MLRAMKAKAVAHSPSPTLQNKAQPIDADYEVVKKDKA